MSTIAQPGSRRKGIVQEGERNVKRERDGEKWYNAGVQRVTYLPPAGALSLFTATILLAYTLAQYIRLPAQTFSVQFAGVYLEFALNINTLTALLVAALVASGMDGLLRTHPSLPESTTVIHWLLPALSAWVLGATLSLLRPEQAWWLGVLIGGAVLALVCVAEYIVVDPKDARYPWATSGLTVLAFGLFLALAISLHEANLRLFWRIPTLTLAAALTSLRVLHLHLRGAWAGWETYTAALLTAQTAAFLHYWRLPSARYGIFVLTPLYAFVTWQHARYRKTPRPWIEALAAAALLIILGAFL